MFIEYLKALYFLSLLEMNNSNFEPMIISFDFVKNIKLKSFFFSRFKLYAY